MCSCSADFALRRSSAISGVKSGALTTSVKMMYAVVHNAISDNTNVSWTRGASWGTPGVGVWGHQDGICSTCSTNLFQEVDRFVQSGRPICSKWSTNLFQVVDQFISRVTYVRLDHSLHGNPPPPHPNTCFPPPLPALPMTSAQPAPDRRRRKNQHMQLDHVLHPVRSPAHMLAP
eukprot:366125-Chlamydomonas_euryale.AAC.10